MKSWVYIGIISLIISTVAMAYAISFVSPYDVEEYTSLVSPAGVKTPSSGGLIKNQVRNGVRKDLLINEKGSRTSSVMHADLSNVEFVQQDGEERLIESMHNVTCSLPGGEQLGRHLESQNAVVDYKSRQFTGEKVTITFDSGTATADEASYSFNPQNTQKGILHLSSKNTNSPCVVILTQGDRIQGSEIWVDTQKQEIAVDNSQGFVNVGTGNNQPLYFSAQHLVWKESQGQLNLKNNVVVRSKEFGMLCSDRAELKTGDGNGALNKMTNLKNALVRFAGNVKMCNHFAGNAREVTPLDQYALADAITYTPKNRLLTLHSSGSHRVLFYDKANRVQVSAPKVVIFGNHTFKGVGDVRCTFAEQELEVLKKQFPAITASF
jgi:lipopolysaccharide export system protein LptA